MSHNEDCKVLSLLDKDFRELLVEVAQQEVLLAQEMQYSKDSSEWEAHAGEWQALKDLCDLDYMQFEQVAESAMNLFCVS